MSQPQPSSPSTCAADSELKLSLWDAICLIVGIIIGASIYQYPPDIFRSAGNAERGMIAWIVGGVVSLLGALCYAELASAYRTAGGDYTYLTRAYGSRVGFIFAWAELSVIRTGGSIACMAYIFAKNASQFLPLGEDSKLYYAVGGILVLTFINAIGVRPGRVVQNALTVGNFIGLGGICLIGLWWFVTQQPHPIIPPPKADPDLDGGPVEQSLALTMVLVFYAYGGWNEAAFIASEVENPRQNIRRSLILGTSLVMLIYVAVNLAYLAALGYEGVCNSTAVASEMFALPFGETGRWVISGLVMVSALGSVNGLLFTGMRLYGAFGSDHRLFRWLAGKGDQPHGAYGALFAQAAFSLLLIGVVELAVYWREILAQIAPLFNLELSKEFRKSGDIERIVTCTAPVFWVFFLLTGSSLFVLRSKEPDRERPFRVPLYPFVPLIFCSSCAFMLWRSTAYALDREPAEAFIVGGLLLLGLPLFVFSGKSSSASMTDADSMLPSE